MTIAGAFNEIAVEQGGTADTSGTVAGAVDALTDALAGEDVPRGKTIEAGVRALGSYIATGAGDGGTAALEWVDVSDKFKCADKNIKIKALSDGHLLSLYVQGKANTAATADIYVSMDVLPAYAKTAGSVFSIIGTGDNAGAQPFTCIVIGEDTTYIMLGGLKDPIFTALWPL